MNNESAISKKGFTPLDISSIYGIPEGSLANMRCKRIGPKFYKAGRKVIYRAADVEAWLYSQPVLTRDSIPER